MNDALDNFSQYVQKIHPLTPTDLAALLAIVETHTFPKQHVLIRHEAICRHLFFLHSGMVRIFYFKEEKEITEWFGTAPTFFSSLKSVFQAQPSQMVIQTLEESVVLRIVFDDLERLCEQYPNIELLNRKLLTASLLASLDRVEALQFQTAQQRYEQLLATKPEIIQRAPLQHIASFLGVTQETLSRIRKK
jgi:CRP/FNR family transcriptional regulator, anaerobic regulatory protein